LAADKKKKDELRSMDDESSGRLAATIVRDKFGKQLSEAEIHDQSAEGKKKKAEAEAKMEWGGGLVQQAAKAQSAVEQRAEMAKPLARYRDDEDLNDMQMQVDRWGDPMLHMANKTAKKETGDPSKRKSQRPMYKGAPWPNRYSIKPGYRWDGRDRSGGWELKLVTDQHQRKINTEAGYKWSSEDM
jgi:pre-mRNA-splicing factor CWC26